MRRLLVAMAALLGVGASVLLWRQGPRLVTERLEAPTPTPVTSAWDQTVCTREIILAQETWYAIQTGVFSTREAAQGKAADYDSRGAPGTVVADGGKWRVFIACYGREEEAARVRQRLGENQRIETYLYHWTCPELRLRLTGMAGQMDVLEAGFQLVCQMANVLRDAAILLDAGEMTQQEVQQRCIELDKSVTIWSRTAQDRFAHHPPDAMKQLLAITDAWPARSRKLQAAASSATELSATLKSQGMELFASLIALRAGIDRK